MKRSSLFITFLSVIAPTVLADGNDWVNPSFVLQKTSGYPKSQQRIIFFAGATLADGPWDITNTTVAPPSGDKRDYLSWAPYHWPDCNWCPSSSRQHMATGGNRTNTTDGSTGNNSDESPYEDGGGSDDGEDDDSGETNSGDDEDDETDDLKPDGEGGGDGDVTSLPFPVSVPLSHRRMVRRVRSFGHLAHPRPLLPREITTVGEPSVSLPTNSLGGEEDSSSSADYVASSPNGAQNARKTGTKGKPSPEATSSAKGKPSPKPTKTKASTPSSCTPSPSKPLPPSATWTLCNYVVRDGRLNPDVRSIPGVQDVVDVTETILLNSLAWVFTGTDSYAQNVASVIQGFFLDPRHGTYPSINYGQVIRGPGKQVGQYLGILDFRGMVKVVNGIQVLRQGNAAAWTKAVDSAMVAWTKQYTNWLETSALGQKAASAPNNHGTFFVNQAGSLYMLLNDPTSAKAAVTHYFNNQFQDQIAASGEQPFEAVRTRPYHYRCFNLEAMITNAKLGDQLGLNFWTAKSKYGANIQNAMDYVLKIGPGKEDISDSFALVAAVAAVYGDPTGKYGAYLKKNDALYMVAPYYYYNQLGAFNQAPAEKGGKGSGKDDTGNVVNDSDVSLSPTRTAKDSVNATVASDPNSGAAPTPTISFECPAVFATATSVQLDDGVYVTCDQLKPFYGYVDDVTDSA